MRGNHLWDGEANPKRRDDSRSERKEQVMDNFGKWYAIQTATGQEANTMTMCRTLVDGSLRWQIFSPEAEYMKRYHGSWHKERRLMFAGYFFVATDRIDDLYLEFKRVPKLTKLLGTDKTPVALSDDEITLLKRLMNPEGIVEVSDGILEGDTLVVTSGPLKGMEGQVKRINRHKRTAVVSVGMFGRIVEMTLGLEVMEKRGS